jgi:hypothetical protein
MDILLENINRKRWDFIVETHIAFADFIKALDRISEYTFNILA